MKDEDNIIDYFNDFRAQSADLIHFNLMTRRECNKLFWQGFHCANCARLYPHLVNRHSFRKPGPDFNFWELSDRVHDIFAQWRLEDEAARANAV